MSSSTKRALTRDAILKQGGGTRLAFIETGDDGAGFFVRQVSVPDWIAFRALVTAAQEKGESVSDAALLVRSICDESGARIFHDEDYEELDRALGLHIQRKAAEETMRLLGFSDSDLAAVLELAEKNQKPAGVQVPVPAGGVPSKGPRRNRRTPAAQVSGVVYPRKN